MKTVSQFDEKTINRFLAKVLPILHHKQCWEWIGSKNPDRGYGRLHMTLKDRSHKKVLAHRFSYELFYGYINNEVIHHVSCVNPCHLEATTQKLNTIYAEKNGTETHCLHGHEFTETNTKYGIKGERICRECHRDQSRRYYYKKKTAKATS
jgi:hypothetical protein